MAITKSNGAPPNELKVGMMVCAMASVVKEMKTSTEDIIGFYLCIKLKYINTLYGYIC